jgi:hypothetical protein
MADETALKKAFVAPLNSGQASSQSASSIASASASGAGENGLDTGEENPNCAEAPIGKESKSTTANLNVFIWGSRISGSRRLQGFDRRLTFDMSGGLPTA